MAKYMVPITRDCTETTRVDVEAATLEDAIAKALEEARTEPNAFRWAHDDCSGDQTVAYFAGGDDYSAIERTDTAEDDWRYEVANGDTRLGFREWCEARAAMVAA